jgi:hypothetical protein
MAVKSRSTGARERHADLRPKTAYRSRADRMPRNGTRPIALAASGQESMARSSCQNAFTTGGLATLHLPGQIVEVDGKDVDLLPS